MEKKENAGKKDTEGVLSSVKITSSGIKYFVLCVIFLTVVVLLWGFLGRIPVKIYGIGTISTELSETTITSNYHGIVTSVYKQAGDTIRKGEKLVRMEEFDLAQAIDESRLNLKQSLKEDSVELLSLGNEKIQRLKTFDLDKQKLERLVESINKKIAFFEDLYDEKKLLLDNGIISNSEFKETEFSLREQKVLLIDTESKLSSLKLDEESYLNSVVIKRSQINDHIKMLTEKLNNLLAKDKQYSYITSIYDAVILEVLVDKNETIEENHKVFTIKLIDTDDNDLYVDMFIPFSEKARATDDMEVVVAPYNVDKNRYGQIVGDIIEMNDFPATEEFMSNLLIDEDVVSIFASKGPVYYARAKLVKDAKTVSGLKWTSRKGVPYKIKPGMICETEIYVDFVSPMSLVIPWFKKEMSDE